MKGFDYRLGKPVERPVREWRHEMRTLIEKGVARRRAESDKDGMVTYLHVKGQGIAFEIYGYVAL